MILRNALYRDVDSGKTLRVLDVLLEKKCPSVILISVEEETSMPYRRDYEDVLEEIRCGSLQMIENSVADLPSMNLSAKQAEARDKAWKAIGTFVQDVPNCYNKKQRNQFIKYKVTELGVSKMRIYRWLHSYWAGGMTIDALIPRYDKRGSGGENVTCEGRRAGRKPQYPRDNIGMFIGETEQEQIRSVVDRFYNKNTKYSYAGCYKVLLEEYYTDEAGKLLSSYPTYAQFHYHAIKYLNLETRVGEKKYAQNFRGLSGRGASIITGPGMLAQMDSTILDVSLVLPHDESKVIGRPTLYLLVDVFSHLIMAYHLTMEHPSFECVKKLLYNCATDKVQFALKHNVDIKREYWPCACIPRKILTDNGECRGKTATSIPLNVGIELLNTSSYRPDMKGLVERTFGLINSRIRQWVPGAVQPNAAERGVPDYRMNSCLTLAEVHKILINCIVAENRRTLGDYPEDADDLRGSGIRPQPAEIWKWGLVNRGNVDMSRSPEELRFLLLPQAEARVTEKGIRFKGVYYTCQTAIKDNWFSIARQKGIWPVTITYDPNCLDTIYVHKTESKTLEECERNECDKNKFLGYSEVEIDEANNQFRALSMAAKEDSLQSQVNAQRNIRAIANEAEKRNGKARKEVVNIRDNRKKAQAIEREAESENRESIAGLLDVNQQDIARTVLTRLPINEDKSLTMVQNETRPQNGKKRYVELWGSPDDEI